DPVPGRDGEERLARTDHMRLERRRILANGGYRRVSRIQDRPGRLVLTRDERGRAGLAPGHGGHPRELVRAGHGGDRCQGRDDDAGRGRGGVGPSPDRAALPTAAPRRPHEETDGEVTRPCERNAHLDAPRAPANSLSSPHVRPTGKQRAVRAPPGRLARPSLAWRSWP